MKSRIPLCSHDKRYRNKWYFPLGRDPRPNLFGNPVAKTAGYNQLIKPDKVMEDYT
jgi:hypothetical protein